MANRYWVGGTGNWSDDDNHWATSSGGTPADGNIPGASDNCIINSNSGFGSGGTITMDIDGECHDLTLNSGHSYSMSAGVHGLFFSGSASLESGASGFVIGFNGSTSETITTNSCSLDVLVVFGSGTLTLQDNLIASNNLGVYLGTFDANDKNLSIGFGQFVNQGGNITLIMGSGTWTITGYDTGGNYAWNVFEQGGYTVTITPETSTIKLTDTSANAKSFIGGGKTYNNLWITGTGTGQYNIKGANTFNDFKDDNSVAHSVIFPNNATTTVSSFTVSGSSGNLITLNSDDNSGTGEILTSEINNGGSGWAVNDWFYIDSGNGDSYAYVSTVSSGVITGYTIDTAGTGYTVESAVSIISVVNSGGITGSSLNNAGSGYLAGETLTVSGGNGDAAFYINTVDGSGSITDGWIDSNGSGYSTGNNISMTGGSGSNATINITQVFSGTGGTINILSVSEDKQFTLSKSSGTVSCDYLDLSNSNATGGATWYAGSHSNNTTNNTGWIFTDLPSINYTLDCSVTAYTLTGVNVIFNKTLNLITSATAYTLTGVNVILSKGYTLLTSVTAYTLTGIDVILTKSLNLITSVTNYTLTGIDVIFTRGYTLLTEVTSYTLTGIDVIFSKGYNLFTSATSYVLTGIDIILKITLGTVHDNIKRNITLKKVLTNISLKKNKLEITTKKDKNLNIKVG